MNGEDSQQRKNLYDLCEELSATTEDRDELAEILSYSIARGILENTKRSQSSEILKKGYSSLEKTIEKAKDDGSYQALFEIRREMSNTLKNINRQEIMKKKNIYHKFVNFIVSSEGNIEETFRRKGLTILEK